MNRVGQKYKREKCKSTSPWVKPER